MEERRWTAAHNLPLTFTGHTNLVGLLEKECSFQMPASFLQDSIVDIYMLEGGDPPLEIRKALDMHLGGHTRQSTVTLL